MTHEELCSNANLASVAVALSLSFSPFFSLAHTQLLMLTSLVPFFSFLKNTQLKVTKFGVHGTKVTMSLMVFHVLNFLEEREFMSLSFSILFLLCFILHVSLKVHFLSVHKYVRVCLVKKGSASVIISDSIVDDV